MATPTVAARAQSGSASNSSTIAVNLPAGITAGDLLVILVNATHAQTTPTGWTRLGSEDTFGGRYVDRYWKVASGSEGTTVNITLSAAGVFSAIAFRITGDDGTGPVSTSAATGSSTTPDPPLLSPGATADWLYLALFASSSSTGSVTGTPTGYSNLQTSIVAFSSCTTASVEKATTGSSSDNPSAFTFTSSNWDAYTVAIKGTAPVQHLTGVGGIATAEAIGTVRVYDPTTPATITVMVDWNNDGVFNPDTDVLSGVTRVSWDRGRSADFSSDATGSASVTLKDVGATLSAPGEYSTLIQAGTLIPGLPIRIDSTWRGVTRPHFFGYIQRATPNAQNFTVSLTVYDPLRRYQETDIAIPASAFVSRSARDFRREVLSDVERGTLNIVSNPAFAVDTSGWSGSGLTRITTDAPPGASACGQWVASGAGSISLSAYLAPFFLAGQVYTISAYVKWISGDTSIAIGGNYDSNVVKRTFTATGTWQRISASYIIPNTVYPVSTSPLYAIFSVTAAATILIGNVAITRGQTLYPYADVGTGRWGNWCGNGSFDGGALTGWHDGLANLIGNPSFEVDTSGWSAAGDAFTTTTSITRYADTPAYGVARAQLGGTGGAFYALPGVFKAGTTYDISIQAKAASGTVKVGIGSQGTPTDKGESAAVSMTGSYRLISTTWTPSADRSDVHFYVTQSSAVTTSIDGAAVFRRDSSSTSAPPYSDTGIGGGGAPPSAFGFSSTAKYGSLSHSFTTPATAKAGRLYDFNHIGVEFVGGQPYTLSMWVRPSSDMPFKAGLGSNKGNGTWDEASTTGTAPANVWTHVTVTWTPTASWTTLNAFSGLLYIYQTDATARTVLLDGVRVIPGSSADEFEMSHWDLDAEDDQYGTGASLTGSALNALVTLNNLTLTRHYIRPSLVAPYYVYVTSGRKSLSSKTVVETMADTFAGFEVYDIDRDSIINVVPVFYAGNTAYYSDEASILQYGPRPTNQINGAGFFPDRTVPDQIGPALIERYKDPRPRPTLRRRNKNDTQLLSILERDLDDLIEVSLGRLGIVSRKYLIVKLQVSVGNGQVVWEASWDLEEHAY